MLRIRTPRFGLVTALFAGLTLAGGCRSNPAIAGPRTGETWGSDAGVVEPEVCTQPRASEPLPARAAVTSSMVSAAPRPVYTESLFRDFRFRCGGCHVDTNQGGFQVTFGTFASKLQQDLHDAVGKGGPDGIADFRQRVQSDDPDHYMPPKPNGKPWSERAADPNDPVALLLTSIGQWQAAGSPPDLFFPPPPPPDESTSPYLLSPEVGSRMSNLGNCIPKARIVGIDTTAMQDRDAFFASAVALPKRLDETDLTTLDATTLARHGVVAFAPAYPLWSDGAGKLRFVRVPHGQSIRYDPTTREFVIPPNTRFYKTFMKDVVDDQGNRAFRKIETRLIVARPDTVLPDGTTEPTALFGTYQWNEDETAAVLVDAHDAPLRSGEPFVDKELEYDVDELLARRIREEAQATHEDAVAALRGAHAVRHYEIPGRDRCVQCHMGSSTRSFVLGFTPLQIHRRPTGTGGVIEPASEDDLSQLQRLSDYGIITGLDVEDAVPLESSQLPRTPRNEHELIAQGYVLGNCAHCHNPRGFPSVSFPALRDAFDLWPSESGGTFQFPLDRMSPRNARGAYAQTRIPYITGSLRDVYRDPNDARSGTFDQLAAERPDRFQYLAKQESGGSTLAMQYVDAPWRSFLYRNTDTPYAYPMDETIFPHMPMNTAGYDCRARSILGDWMVSIPARYAGGSIPEERNSSDQPYTEVLPSDPDYPAALAESEQRLARYHASARYSHCPDVSDVVAPEMILGARAPLDVLGNDKPADALISDPLTDGIPDRAHWFVTDSTEPPGDWNPRRADWKKYLLPSTSGLPEAWPALDANARAAIQAILATSVTSASSPNAIDLALVAFYLGDVPIGLWQQKPQCDFHDVPLDTSFYGPTAAPWLREREAAGAAPAPVYSASRGEMVFRQICFNCHGPRADGRSALASTISALTGGDTRVANLRAGVFGPEAMPRSNLTRVFTDERVDGTSPLDWSARYLMWMATGGTTRWLPPAVLSIIGNMPFLGERRGGAFDSSRAGGNMLSTARNLCHEVLPARPPSVGNDGALSFNFRRTYFDVARGVPRDDAGVINGTLLIPSNGDATLWRTLCSYGNPAPVRVLYPQHQHGDTRLPVEQLVVDTRQEFNDSSLENLAMWSLYARSAYPAGAAVGNQYGQIVDGLTDDNLMPWCLRRPTDPTQLAQVVAYAHAHAIGGRDIPFCPDAMLGARSNLFKNSDIAAWTLRGALNAGRGVFLYLDALSRGVVSSHPEYTQCEQLQH